MIQRYAKYLKSLSYTFIPSFIIIDLLLAWLTTSCTFPFGGLGCEPMLKRLYYLSPQAAVLAASLGILSSLIHASLENLGYFHIEWSLSRTSNILIICITALVVSVSGISWKDSYNRDEETASACYQDLQIKTAKLGNSSFQAPSSCFRSGKSAEPLPENAEPGDMIRRNSSGGYEVVEK